MTRDAIRQLAFVTTKDRFDETLRFWGEAFGTGPFWVMEFSLPGQTLRGKPTAAASKAALTMQGNTQIEVLCALDDEPSVYTEWIEKHGGEVPPAGLFHHFLVDADDHAATRQRIIAHGAAEGFEGVMPDGRSLSYLDGGAVTGSYIEVVSRTEQAMKVVAAMTRECENWDGSTEPVRDYIDFLAELTGSRPDYGRPS